MYIVLMVNYEFCCGIGFVVGIKKLVVVVCIKIVNKVFKGQIKWVNVFVVWRCDNNGMGK